MGNHHHKPLRPAIRAHQCYPSKYDNIEPASPKPTQKKSKGIRFGNVHVREYDRTIGESVSGGGPAVGLGWELVEETKYKSLEHHEKDVIMARYRVRGMLSRLPSRSSEGIIEFQSLQDEYWIPPNKRHALLLLAGVEQNDVLESVVELDTVRAQRKEANGDKEALAFALALHHNLTEEEVMARLGPPPPRARQPAPAEPPGMDEEPEPDKPKVISMQTNAMIALRLKSKARRAVRRVTFVFIFPLIFTIF
jgi:hypothetical protein